MSEEELLTTEEELAAELLLLLLAWVELVAAELELLLAWEEEDIPAEEEEGVEELDEASDWLLSLTDELTGSEDWDDSLDEDELDEFAAAQAPREKPSPIANKSDSFFFMEKV
ncbi:MAG: hypothetical protein Q4F15_00110 [Bacillota bacterium]|nr:hypothetical protein [Bacillota bacterium]